MKTMTIERAIEILDSNAKFADQWGEEDAEAFVLGAQALRRLKLAEAVVEAARNFESCFTEQPGVCLPGEIDNLRDALAALDKEQPS